MPITPCEQITSGLNGTSCTSNPGGVSEFYLINYDDLTTVTFTGGTVSSILTAGVTASFFEYSFRRNTASVAEDLTKDLNTGSAFYSQTATIVLDKIEKTKRDELMLLDQAVIAYIAKHTNGSYWLYGSTDGAYVTTNVSSTGTQKTDQNGYTITILSEEAERGFPVDPVLGAAIAAAAQ